MTTELHISPQLIERFDHAASLARKGDFEGSLRAWDRLLEPDGSGTHTITGDFLGQAYMRKAWVLMDLSRHVAARQVFEDPVMRACLGQFSLTVLYDYYFSYANTLGNLGDVSAMDDAFTRAMNIAADELGDTWRMHLCWSNLLTWAEGAHAWEYIDVETETCLAYAANVGDDVLAGIARLSRAMALARMGRKHEARAIIEPMLEGMQGRDLPDLAERLDAIRRAIKE